MKSKGKSVEELNLKQEFATLKKKQQLLKDIKKVISSLLKSDKDLQKAELLLARKVGEKKAKYMVERYTNFMGNDINHPDNRKNLFAD